MGPIRTLNDLTSTIIDKVRTFVKDFEDKIGRTFHPIPAETESAVNRSMD
jgi:hypothetical protein